MKSKLLETRTELDRYSPTLCLAKWLHSTIHLQHGLTHSCYHNPPHAISNEEIQHSPKALYQTEIKHQHQQEMLQGKKPKDCSFCWKIEEGAREDIFSDRIIKSAAAWAQEKMPVLIETHFQKQVDPSYLELSFASTCNLKCTYCGPQYSTAWQNEIATRGNFQSTGHLQFNSLDEESNPYIKAFWEIWPQLKTKLKILRLTGGEPLLSKNIWKILESLDESTNGIQLIINSNLAIPAEMIESLIRKISLLKEKKFIANVKIITSMEAIFEKAEFIRTGLKFSNFLQNFELVLQKNTEIDLSITSTISLYSIDSYPEFLRFFIDLRKEKNLHFVLDPSPLKNPKFLNIEFASKRMSEKFYNDLESIMNEYSDHISEYEILKLKALQKVVGQSGKDVEHLKKLNHYSLEVSIRNNKDYKALFPSLVVE